MSFRPPLSPQDFPPALLDREVGARRRQRAARLGDPRRELPSEAVTEDRGGRVVHRPFEQIARLARPIAQDPERGERVLLLEEREIERVRRRQVRICCGFFADRGAMDVEGARKGFDRGQQPLLQRQDDEHGGGLLGLFGGRQAFFAGPGRSVRLADVVQIREKSKKQLRVVNALTVAAQVGFPEWLEVNEKEMRGVFKAAPNRDDVLPDINENLVVELYSK